MRETMLPSNGSCLLSFQALLGTDAQALVEGSQQDSLRKLILSPQQRLLYMGTEWGGGGGAVKVRQLWCVCLWKKWSNVSLPGAK